MQAHEIARQHALSHPIDAFTIKSNFCTSCTKYVLWRLLPLDTYTDINDNMMILLYFVFIVLATAMAVSSARSPLNPGPTPDLRTASAQSPVSRTGRAHKRNSSTYVVANASQQPQPVTKSPQPRLFPPFSFMSSFFSHALQLFIEDQDVLKLVSRFCAFVVWTALSLSVAGSLGVDTKPLLGLASMAFLTIGVGAKDVLTNTFAGLFVIFARPFRRGSSITIHASHGPYSGNVVAIDMRYVRLQQTKGQLLVPLGVIINTPITVEEL
jgi:small-conductance mechanosensitive channel